MKIIDLEEVEELPNTRVESVDVGAVQKAALDAKATALALEKVRLDAVNERVFLRSYGALTDIVNGESDLGLLKKAVLDGFRFHSAVGVPTRAGSVLLVYRRPSTVDQHYTPYQPALSEGK